MQTRKLNKIFLWSSPQSGLCGFEFFLISQPVLFKNAVRPDFTKPRWVHPNDHTAAVERELCCVYTVNFYVGQASPAISKPLGVKAACTHYHDPFDVKIVPSIAFVPHPHKLPAEMYGRAVPTLPYPTRLLSPFDKRRAGLVKNSHSKNTRPFVPLRVTGREVLRILMFV